MKTIYLHRLNKGFGSKFCVDSWVQHETPEQNWRMHWMKCCENNSKYENHNPNSLSLKISQASSQKFRQMRSVNYQDSFKSLLFSVDLFYFVFVPLFVLIIGKDIFKFWNEVF